jgi:hypothetical protein
MNTYSQNPSPVKVRLTEIDNSHKPQVITITAKQQHHRKKSFEIVNRTIVERTIENSTTHLSLHNHSTDMNQLQKVRQTI